MRKVVSRDGTTIAYDKSGEGPPLVLLNGAFRDHTIFDELVPELAQHCTVYAYDRRGRGQSNEGTTAVEGVDEEAASDINCRCTAATFPPHSASSARTRGVTTAVLRTRAVNRPSARAAATQFHTVRSLTPAADATRRTCAVANSPRPSSTINRETAPPRDTRPPAPPTGTPDG